MSIEDLAKPFPAGDIEWRIGATNKDKTKGVALAYITARAVMNRLDEVLGPENWQDTYSAIPGTGNDTKGYLCTISIRLGDTWVSKQDGADESNMESIKGGLSDAFKRAAVKWGVGRYLYDLPNTWVPIDSYGNSYKLAMTPSLPDWALPDYVVPPKQETTTSTPYYNTILGIEDEDEEEEVQANEDDYSPLEIIKDEIRKKLKFTKYTASNKQVKLIGILTRGFWPDEIVRHAILNDLFGYELTEEKAMTVEVAAFMKWLDFEQTITDGPDGKKIYNYSYPADVEALLALIYEEYSRS